MDGTMQRTSVEATDLPFEYTTACVSAFVFALSYFFLNYLNILSRKRYPNGPWGVPVLGHLPFFGKQPLNTFDKWRKRYGDVYRIQMGSWRTVIVNGYSAIKEAANKPDDDFSSRPGFMTQTILANIYGEQSLAFGPFNKTYLGQRKLSAAALRKFTNRSGNVTEDMIVEAANSLVDVLLSKDYSQPRDIKPDIQYSVGSVILQLLYGRGMHIDRHLELKLLVDTTNKFIKFAGNGNPFDVMPWLKYVMPWKVDQLIQILTANDETRKQQIKEHTERFSKDNINDITDAFLAADIEERKKSDKAMRLTKSLLLTTIGSLQGAGFDTTNKTLQWLLLYMAVYPDVQERVQREIDDVIGSGGIVQLGDQNKLTYTDATIHEVMRIAVLAPLGLPKYTTKDTQLNGYDIDKDTVVFFNLHSVSYDKEFWEDPENFRPSRFLTKDNQLDKTKCSRILPFGVGRRRCVGETLAKMEIFLLFVTVMRRCSIVKPKGVEFDLEPVPGLAYSPSDFKVVVRER